ncbi:MAG TPA: hypothetical protein VFR97_08460 [Capillimicrobium sp.]|nr:hypothetical protein [Capillimicrobium sp.]
MPGWTYGASFRLRERLIDSLVDYERWVLEELRHVQRALWLHSRRGPELEREADRAERAAAHALAGRVRPSRLPTRAARSQREAVRAARFARAALVAHAAGTGRGRALLSRVARELWSVRLAVDAEAVEHDGLPPAVAAMRAAPVRPVGVREYLDAEAFVAEDPRREVVAWSDHGDRWLLENPLRRWETTRWRLAWLVDATDEVCAVELLDRPDARVETGRVWLLGVVRDRSSMLRALRDLERTAQGERNSLVLVGDAIARVARERPVG